jgi:hypothetical protein
VSDVRPINANAMGRRALRPDCRLPHQPRFFENIRTSIGQDNELDCGAASEEIAAAIENCPGTIAALYRGENLGEPLIRPRPSRY